ncbi:MAG: DUF5518 domain-containing protein [Methanobacteriaceae archaeon]|nr:DUF5518 domain-containing protein [Methanobacteriaceae archaeon]
MSIKNYEFNYLSSISIGIFVSSIILFMSRIVGMPITGIITSILLAPLIAAFIYNPSLKEEVKHRSMRGIGSSFIFSTLLGIIFVVYYIPKVNNLLGSTDLSLTFAILLIALIATIGGILLGAIGGSIGATLRDIVTLLQNH